MIKNYLCDVLRCKYSVLSLHPQAARFVVNPVRGVVDFNTNFNFYFGRLAEYSARVCEGFAPLAFLLFCLVVLFKLFLRYQFIFIVMLVNVERFSFFDVVHLSAISNEL